MNSQLSPGNSQFTIALIAGGLVLFLFGLAHRLPVLSRWDVHAFKSAHEFLQPYSRLFRYIWPLGTTPVAVLLLAICFIPGWLIGLPAALIYVFFAILEPLIKTRLRRPRPFNALSGVNMQQPKLPHDWSHPSGDALRVWYLAIVLPAAFSLPWPVTLAAGLIAFSLSLGRVALGVHYPLDVIAGSGLGLLAAGLALLIYQYSAYSVQAAIFN